MVFKRQYTTTAQKFPRSVQPLLQRPMDHIQRRNESHSQENVEAEHHHAPQQDAARRQSSRQQRQEDRDCLVFPHALVKGVFADILIFRFRSPAAKDFDCDDSPVRSVLIELSLIIPFKASCI